MQIIIYINESGNVSIVTPSPAALDEFGIFAIAVKDVPHGKPFAIIDAASVPEDMDAWAVDPDSLTDGIGGESDIFLIN